MRPRPRHLRALQGLLERFPVVGILGARQVGKSTLARTLVEEWEGPTHFFDLESPEDQARLAEPLLTLRPLEGLVILDEIQRLPGVFETLRVLADRPELPARFLVLGSASPELLRQGSETLAGRIVYRELTGFALDELEPGELQRRWRRGGFPRSFLAATEPDSVEWRTAFLRTFLERDVSQHGIEASSETMRRFWTMLAHTHGQSWNASEFSRAFGLNDKTVRRYLDLLGHALVVTQLPAWRENLRKRQVRAPKIYVSDSGLLHSLLGIETQEELESHPKVGASWEGFLLGQVLEHLGVAREHCFYWGTHAGAELDLLVARGGHRRGFEFKRTAQPRVTRSMRAAVEDLRLERLDLIHAGEHSFPLDEGIQAIAAGRLLEDLG